jgi:hypothetical protein
MATETLHPLYHSFSASEQVVLQGRPEPYDTPFTAEIAENAEKRINHEVTKRKTELLGVFVS